MPQNPGKTFLSIGECMVELSGGHGGLFSMGFAGDTLNTASKLEKIAGEFGRRAVISRDLLDRLRLPAGVNVEPLGAVEVPGRSQRMELFALQLWPG